MPAFGPLAGGLKHTNRACFIISDQDTNAKWKYERFTFSTLNYSNTENQDFGDSRSKDQEVCLPLHFIYGTLLRTSPLCILCFQLLQGHLNSAPEVHHLPSPSLPYIPILIFLLKWTFTANPSFLVPWAGGGEGWQINFYSNSRENCTRSVENLA